MGLVHVFGDKPVPKVLDFFRVHAYWDYSLKDISKATQISHRTLQQIMPLLVRHGFLKYTRTEGKAKLYMFNSKSVIAKELHGFARTIDFEFVNSAGKRKADVKHKVSFEETDFEVPVRARKV